MIHTTWDPALVKEAIVDTVTHHWHFKDLKLPLPLFIADRMLWWLDKIGINDVSEEVS
jgi:hypothetical protein